MQPQVLNLTDAAIALQRHRSTLYRMIRRGELHSVRFGSRRSIPVAEIHRLVESGQ